MSTNNSDYKKVRTNLNDFIPAINRTDTSETIMENLPNRLLSKDEFTHIIGIAGKLNPLNSAIKQIIEPTEYLQKNQLEPVVTGKVGSINHYMSFPDMLNRLEDLGIDISKFNEWGNATQFNWVPPVDIDKLTNYADYFWKITDTFPTPDYIVIKNLANWAYARSYMAKKTIYSSLPVFNIKNITLMTSTVSVAGNVASNFNEGDYIILYDGKDSYDLFLISSISFNIVGRQTNIVVSPVFKDLTSSYTSFSKTKAAIDSFAPDNKSLAIEGFFTNLFKSGYVFAARYGTPVSISMSNSIYPVTLFETKSSTYDGTTTTVEIVNDDNKTLSNYDQIDFTPFIFLLEGEYLRYQNTNPYFSDISMVQNYWQPAFLARLPWTDEETVFSEQTTGQTVFGETYLIDHTQNFTTSDIQLGDYVLINDGPNLGKFQIISITPENLYFNSNVKLFTGFSIGYKVVRNFNYNDLYATTNPGVGSDKQYIINSTTNTLYQYGTSFVPLVENFSLIKNITRNRESLDVDNSNDWAQKNFWMHKDQISDFTDMIRAQLPIIEYSPYVDLATVSYSRKYWKYRSTSNNPIFANTDAVPLNFEILNISLSGTTDPEFKFDSLNSILLHEKFGNLTNELVNGFKIRLTGFGANNGIYEVLKSEFIQTLSTRRYQTRILLKSNISNPFDLPLDAKITPILTSQGDVWTGYLDHWELDDIEISASSVDPIKNPMLNSFVGAVEDYTSSYRSISEHYQTYYGLVWQEFSPLVSTVNPTLVFHSSLQNLVLIDEYQEGDIRVYVNGERQYGNFTDLPELIDHQYVVGITFTNGLVLGLNDTVRIELGEYALADIGRREMPIRTSVNPTPTGDIDLPDVLPNITSYNLVDYRLIEQKKTDINQYPYFRIYDVSGDPLLFSNSLFIYKEQSNQPINSILNKRVIFDALTRNYTFSQLLSDPITGEMYCYYDKNQTNKLQTIWKVGNNIEQYVPQKLTDGEWDLPNQLYFNVHHENRTDITYTQFFTHFRSIINAQTVAGFISTDGKYSYLSDNINYGLAGTIKEHNDGFDLLTSSAFVNNINPVSLFNFAKEQYLFQLKFVQDEFAKNIGALLIENYGNTVELTDNAITFTKNLFENNDKFDQWFGDSTTYNGIDNTGIKNWIATIPYMNLLPTVKPYYLYDSALKINEIIHHDGHRETYSLQQSLKDYIYKSLLKNKNNAVAQSVATDGASFPVVINGHAPVLGNFVVRTNTTTLQTSLYRFNNIAVWELIDLDAILIALILNIETALYENLDDSHHIDNFKPPFDFDTVLTDSNYNIFEQQQFNQYVYNNKIVTPYLNTDFNQNNPFTWNYFYTPIPNHPISGAMVYENVATWQALYNKVYNTPYPHLEPWKLQGYTEKPNWWDAEYKDTLGSRRWSTGMWNNIFYGVVPSGKTTPSGTAGTGLAYQIDKIYSYVSVNIDATPTADGIIADGLLPPYWNTANTTNPRIKSLYDPNEEQFIVLPSSDYQFGQFGPNEWNWNVSAEKLYDELIVSFKIQPMRFLNQTFGNEFEIVNCLQVDKETKKVFSHKNTVFHGEFISDDTVFYSNGINQWYVHYNRYMGYDGQSSEFKELWTNWDNPLSYLFSSFVDPLSFEALNDVIDVSQSDYQINVKSTIGFQDKWLDALSATLISIPSKYSSLKDKGIGWTAQFNSYSPIARNMAYYLPQNYNFRMQSGNPEFRIYSYNIDNAGISAPQGYQTVNYNGTLNLSDATGFANTNFMYYASILVDNINTINVAIRGYKIQTIDAFLRELNIQLQGKAFAEIDLGNLKISSNTLGLSSSIAITDSGLFVTASSSFIELFPASMTGYKFNGYFEISGNYLNVFAIGDKIVINDSTSFNGTFTIKNIVYDIDNIVTRIFINENITISSGIIDGILEPLNAITLPVEWITGTEIFLNTNGYLANNFDDQLPYYVIRVDDRTFKLSETPQGASQNVPLIPSDDSQGPVFAGKLSTTFKTLTGNSTSQYVWRKHFVDKRYVHQLSQSTYVSGIQSIVDFVTGYDQYNEDLGFLCLNGDGLNEDESTGGRTSDWQLSLEKLIDWMYSLRSLRQQDPLKYQVKFNHLDYSFTIVDQYVGWETGTKVILSTNDASAEFPDVFSNPLTQFVPYYIIQSFDSNRTFQLATSSFDAMRGRAIQFGDNGVGNLYIEVANAQQTPVYEINPIKNYVWVNTPQGVLSNVIKGPQTEILVNPRIYDKNGNSLSNKELIVLRHDKQTRISLTGELIGKIKDNKLKNLPYISGMHLYFDSYENILTFNDNSADGNIIYDKFLGLNTPRFYLQFNRQEDFTLRPNVAGYFLSDDKLIQNMESLTGDLRNLYDTYKSLEKKPMIEQVRLSLGYEGVKDYMTQVGMSPKTQFLFWRGMIQNKGTNFALQAFSNQLVFQNFDIDEYWAYKIADFGDAKEKDYIDMRLYVRDGVHKEARLEFILADDIGTDSTFEAVKLVDPTRWWNQPDQLAAVPGKQAFYFNAAVDRIINITDINAQSLNGQSISCFIDPDSSSCIAGSLSNTFYYYQLPEDVIADGLIITYFDTVTKTTKTLNNLIDYVLINSRIVKFIQNSNTAVHKQFYQQLVYNAQIGQCVIDPLSSLNYDPNSLPLLNIYVLTYDFDSQNPARLIDKKSGTVITNVPLWNPARKQYYSIAENVIDYQLANDPAIYNNTLVESPTDDIWGDDHINKVWFDNKLEGYIPYYDPAIYPSINDRIFLWGNTSDWNDINLYEWSASPVAPSDWAAYVEQTNLNAATSKEKVSGTPIRNLYRNVGTDGAGNKIWAAVNPLIYRDIACLVVIGQKYVNYYEPLDPTDQKFMIYLNGKKDEFFPDGIDFALYDLHQYVAGEIPGQESKPYVKPQDFITVIKMPPVLSNSDGKITSGTYRYDTPYTSLMQIDKISGESKPVYYFWQSGKTNQIALQNGFTTLDQTEKYIKDIPIPYMILDGLKSDQAGFGLVYGNVFDGDDPKLPYRFTKLVVKGLNGIVNQEDRYSLRFTRDFTLRDRMVMDYDSPYTPLYKKNKHEEWVLIREKQPQKIDTYLWNKLTAGLIGYGLGKTVLDQFGNSIVIKSYEGNIENLVINFDNKIPALNRILYDSLYAGQTRFGLADDQIFLDPAIGVNTIKSILSDPTQDFGNIDINQFLNTHNFDTEFDIYNLMSDIYNNFAPKNVNYIFFQTLLDALSTKKESKDFLKTSWVAIDIGQVVGTRNSSVDNPVILQPDGVCGVEEIATSPTPLPQPTPTPTPFPTQTPTPSVTPTHSPTPSVTPTMSPTPSVTPSGLPPSQTPTPTLTPTMTITPTLTPFITHSPTPTVTPTLTQTPTVTPTMTQTPSVTATLTPSPTATATPSATVSPTPSATVTPTPTQTVTPTPSAGITTIWDASRAGPDINLLDTNQTAISVGTDHYEMVMTNTLRNSGKYYAEGKLVGLDYQNGTAVFGLAQDTADLNAPFGTDGLSFGFGTPTDATQRVFFYHNDTSTIFNSSYYTGLNGFVKIAVDFDAGQVWLGGVSGAWLGDGISPTFTFTPNTPLRLAVSLKSYTGQITQQSLTLNTGRVAFAGAIPSGFVPWN